MSGAEKRLPIAWRTQSTGVPLTANAGTSGSPSMRVFCARSGSLSVSARLIANKAHYKFKGEEIEALRQRLEQAVNA